MTARSMLYAPRESEQSIINARLTLVEHIKRDVQEQLEAAAEAIFREKVKQGDIVFKLLAAPLDQLNFEFVEQFTDSCRLGRRRSAVAEFRRQGIGPRSL